MWPLKTVETISEEEVRERARIVERSKTTHCRVAFAMGDAWAVEIMRRVVQYELADESRAAYTAWHDKEQQLAKEAVAQMIAAKRASL